MSGAGSDAASETGDERAARLRRARDTATVVRQRLRVRAENLRGWARGFLGVLTAVLIAGGLGFAFAGVLAQNDISSLVDTKLAPFKAALKSQQDQLPEIDSDLRQIKVDMLAIVPGLAKIVVDPVRVKNIDLPPAESYSIPDTVLTHVFFLDQKTGWVVGQGGTILASADGGVTWHSQLIGEGDYLGSVYFVSATRGWAVGTGGAVLVTTNGGSIWEKNDVSTSDNLYSVHFVSATQGWVVGDHGTIVKTIDGVKWTKCNYGLGDSAPNFRSVYFTSAKQGWVVGDSGTILETVNGCDTWQKLDSGTTRLLMGVHFFSPQIGSVVGDDGTILTTTDGGATWIKRDSGTSALLTSVQVISPTQGWAVGAHGTIVSTTDGGSTWQKQDSGTLDAFLSVQFVGPAQGWVVGGVSSVGQIHPFSAADFGAAITPEDIDKVARNHNIANDPRLGTQLLKYRDKFEEHQRLETNIKQLQDKIDISNVPSSAPAHGGDPEAAKFAIGELFQTNNFALFLIRLGISAFVFFFVGFIITVYRYLMRLAAHYDACADALELCEDPLDPGFSSLVAVLSPASISFGKEPRSIIDHAFGAAQGVAGLAKGRE